MTEFRYPPRVAGLRAALSIPETDGQGLEIAPAVDLLVVSHLENVRYLTGFTGSNGLVIVSDTHALFLTDGRYTLQSAQEVTGFERVIVPQGTPLTRAAATVLTERGLAGARIGYEGAHLTVNAFRTLEQGLGAGLLSRSGLVETLREVKDADEIAAIRRATALVDDCFAHLTDFVRPGQTEKQVAWEIEVFLKTHGASKLGFETICGSGPNAALIHGRPGERVIGSSGGPEFLLCDYGCDCDGYCADITRTFVVGGPPTEAMQAIYSAVQTAQQAALDAIRPGVTGKEVDAVARESLRAAGYGEMPHGLGHGLGRVVHDVPLPTFSPLATVVLRPGVVATVEPGVYIEGLGGVRIEDDILVTDTGIALLTRATKDLIVIG
jgi:Xaa-Pro aminopeptidase